MNIPNRYQCPVLITVCLLAVLVLFVKCFSHDWVYDDTPVILTNQDIRSLANFFVNQNPGRPLRELSYWIDYRLWGFNPGGFMVQNLFWHGLCGGLFGYLLLRLGVVMRWALLGALLFVSHPLTVEVAANSGHRKDSLCLAFILLAVICHLQACREGVSRWSWCLAAGVAFALACLAKQHALMIPLIWLAAELTLVPPEQRIISRWLRWLPTLAGIGVAGAVSWFLLFDGLQRLQMGAATRLLKFNYLEAPTLAAYYRMVVKGLVFAADKILWPLQLAPEYTFSVPANFLDPWVLAAFLLVCVYLVGGLWLWRFRPVWAFFWVWIGVFWLPVSNVWPLAYQVADRYLYTLLIGIVALLVLASREVAGLRRVLIAGMLLIALTVNVCLTWRQIDVWQSTLSLWTHVSRVNPHSTTAFINLSMYSINIAKDFEQGRIYAERAISLNPRLPDARFNHAVALENLGRYSEAGLEYLRTYELYRDKNHPQARNIRNILIKNYRFSPP